MSPWGRASQKGGLLRNGFFAGLNVFKGKEFSETAALHGKRSIGERVTQKRGRCICLVSRRKGYSATGVLPG